MFISKEVYTILNIDFIWQKINVLSPLGKKFKSNIKPFVKGMEEQVQKEFQKVGILLEIIGSNNLFYENIAAVAIHFEDLNIIFYKIKRQEVLEVFEIQEIKDFLYFYLKFRDIILQFNELTDYNFVDVRELYYFLDPEKQNSPTFFISDSYDENYAECKKKIISLKKKIKAENQKLLETAQQKLGINSLEKKIVVSRYNKALIEKLHVSDFFNLESENFANLHYVIRKNDKIVTLEKELKHFSSEIMLLEEKIRSLITSRIYSSIVQLINIQNELEYFDWLLAKADFGYQNNCSIPQITAVNNLEIRAAINLPVYWELQKENIKYQAIDINIDHKINVITGANMAGKTTILKTIGQILFLNAYAIPIPAKMAKLPLTDFIYFSGIQSGRMDLSSFGAEVVFLNEAIKHPGFSLFLIDEFARGTNPLEGEAFSKAVLENFSEKNCLVLFATHFNSPANIKQATHFRVAGLSSQDYQKINFLPDQNLKERLEELHKYMDYSLICVEANTKAPQAALMIAEILGVEKKIINRAKKFLDLK